MNKVFKRYGGLLIFGLALAIRILFALFPPLFETVYFEVAFPFIRAVQYPLGAALPVSGYYFLILFAVVWVVWRFPKKMVKRKWYTFARRLVNFCGGLIAFFLLLWGYNYVGPGLTERMSLPETDEKHEIAELYLAVMHEASEKRNQIQLPEDTASVEDLDEKTDIQKLNRAVKKVLSDLGYPTGTDVVLRRVMPPGALRRVGIRGIYNPFTGEANVESDAGLLTGAFTAAHEMAHAYGIASEGEANLVAYIALADSKNPVWEYSAAYALWRYVAAEVNRKLDEGDRAILAEAIPIGLQIDRLAIWRRRSDAPPYFPELSEAVNDRYLKIQGVESGTEDYNAFVGLYLRYESQIKAK